MLDYRPAFGSAAWTAWCIKTVVDAPPAVARDFPTAQSHRVEGSKRFIENFRVPGAAG